MTVPLDHYVKQLEDSGVLASDTLGDFLPPKSDPKDGEDLARELVRRKKLTKYQAEEIGRGNGKALVLGNYTILDKIGAGGMGEVFKAEHRRMHRIVAVKMLPANMMKNAAVVARFEREVMAVAKLNHPNIVTAFDADNANDVHLLIMEYVEGTDLAALVKKKGPCSYEQAVNYILQSARGLEAAHAEGIVHRDIKPANLLLDKAGTVKILDMGLARLSADVDSDKQAGLTNTGTIMGTVDYMAPEQALDTKTADARADIYSLGCTLFFLLTGRPTYPGDTLMKKLLAHREQPIPSVQAIRPEVPEQMEAVFRKMVAKRIADRYQTMTDVIADLEGLGTRQELSANTQLSLGSSTDAGLTNFLRDISLSEAAPVRRKKPAGPQFSRDKKKLLLIGGGILGVFVLLAGVVINLVTKSGTHVVADANEPDANDQTRSDEGRNEIARKKEKGFANAKIPADTMNDPAYQKWAQQVAVMPADDQVKAVAAKLKQLNAGFDRQVTPVIANGTVRGLSFVTDNVTDIAPVRALPGLHVLNCPGSESGLGELSDLGPLRGLQLDQLNVGNTHVADLSPLEGMPLSTLSCNNTPLVDLSSVTGLPSLLRLYCNDTQIADLSPLAGSKLQVLVCSRTQVSDLSPLHELPLIALEFAGTNVAGLSPLQGLKLTQLMCQNTPIVDLSPLAGMTSLELLFIDDTPVSDLSPLKGLHLKTMHCVGTRVSDLSPLAGMPLTMLVCQGTRVTDLSPIRGMPLYGLYFYAYRPERDGELLRSLRDTLQEVDYRPAATFWKHFGEQEAAIATWKKQVAAMPAEEQVRAVAARLKDLNAGFDGNVTGKIENGKVISLAFVSDNVTDISPVRAIAGLQVLSCPGSAPGQGKLAELWPLRGTSVTQLNVSQTAVADLYPLSEMKLADLDLSGCPVADLSALTRIGLARLNISDTKVTDLGPLAGLPLTFLDYSGVCIADVSPLQKLPLREVRCGFKPARDAAVLRLVITLETIDRQPAATFWKEADARQAAFDRWMDEVAGMPPERQVRAVAQKLKELNPKFNGAVKHEIVEGAVVRLDFVGDYVHDISPVRALTRLTVLDCSGSDPSVGGLADLWPLKGLPLQTLNCGPSQLADLSPLKGTSLQALAIYRSQVSDLKHLAGIPLLSLHCGGLPRVSDLSPLRGMPLTYLNAFGTNVTDLSPLRGMQLTGLDLAGAPISDLSPLQGMPLTSLTCSSTRVSTLAPLKGMPLTVLHCNNTPVNDLSPLTGMPLTYLMCDFSPLRGDARILRTMKDLASINNRPAAEFWKDVEVGPAGKGR